MRASPARCSTQTTQFVSLDVFAFHRSADVLLVLVIGGTGYLYGGLIGAVVFKLLQDCSRRSRRNTGSSGSAWSWSSIVLVGRERMHRWALCVRRS